VHPKITTRDINEGGVKTAPGCSSKMTGPAKDAAGVGLMLMSKFGGAGASFDAVGLLGALFFVNPDGNEEKSQTTTQS
jgi:hypothetical protein